MRPYLRAFTMLLPVAVVLSGAVLVTTDSHDAPARDAALAAARPRGATTLLPQVVQQGTRVAAANRAYLAGQVKFYPTRKGRPVLIQRRVGTGAWNTVATRRQNGAGLVTFTAAAKTAGNKPYTYRGVAKRYNGEAAVAAAPQSAAVWKQQFLDEFKGTSLDPKKWSHRTPGEYAGARTLAAGSEKSVSVKDGTLRMVVKEDQDKPGYYLNGHISTDGRFDFRWGFAAARIKFPRSQGQHGSFWMQPSPNETTTGAEIDVVEYFGDGRKDGGLAHFLYRESDGQQFGKVVPEATERLKRDDDWWKSYHVFSVEWTGKRYVFRVDGVETYRTTGAVSQEEEYLILSLLSSDWELPKLNLQTTPKQMQVDWVRVWKK